MATPRVRRISRIVAIAGAVGQLPFVLLASQLVSLPLVLLASLLLSLPFYLRIARGLRLDHEERGLSQALQLIFFGYWSASLVAGFAFVPAVAIALALGFHARSAAFAALVIGGLSGLAGVTWNRLGPRVHRVDIPVAGLDAALDGYRIAQLSDLHMGGHTSPGLVRSWVDRVNRLAPNLVAVTGDLITSGDQFLERVAQELGRLRATDTVAVCLGNHDYFGDTTRLVAALREAGLEVLRNEGRVVVSTVAGVAGGTDGGTGRFFLAGVDDTWSRRADVSKSLSRKPAELPAIVLAHDPNLFERCVEDGATLVLSGHTHGGQIASPIFPRTLNIARLAHRHTAGLYHVPGRNGRSYLYVNRGAGTTGPPVRIGSPSEITLLTLRRA